MAACIEVEVALVDMCRIRAELSKFEGNALALWMRRFIPQGCEYGENLNIIIIFFFIFLDTPIN